MNTNVNEDSSMFDEVKIMAGVLIPVLNSLRDELGNDRAMDLVKRALNDHFRNEYLEIACGVKGSVHQRLNFFSSMIMKRMKGVLDVEILRSDDKVRELKVTRCDCATLFNNLGERELGTLLCCNLDHHVVNAVGPEVEFKRRGTIMEGADICDACYFFHPAND